MPSGMRSSNASGSLPRRSRAASSRMSRPSTARGKDRTPEAVLMSPPRPSPTAWTDPLSDRRFRLVAVAAVLALLLGLVGCGGDDDSGSDQVVGGSVGVEVAEARAQEQRILNQRARAVREHDLDLFLKRV